MLYASLAEFLEDLEREQLLIRVDAEVGSEMEIAEIARRMLAQRGPALLFARVAGKRLPVVANLLATENRICHALGVNSLAEMAQRLAEPSASPAGGGWLETLRSFPAGNGPTRLEPRLVKNAASQQVVRLGSDVDLDELPFLRCDASEPVKRVLAGVVTTQSADRSERSAEVCRLRMSGRNRLALSWRPHGTTRRTWLGYQRRSEPLPLAISLGGHPLDLIAALAPQPFAGDPWLLTSALRGRAIEIARARTLDLDVAADAEIVLEGVVGTQEPAGEAHLYEATVEVTAITQRANAVVRALVEAPAPHELSVLQAAAQRLFLPALKRLIPELVDIGFPGFGGSSIAVVAIAKNYPGQARKAASLLWGLDAWGAVRVLIVVDESVNLHDDQEIGRRLAAADLQSDLFEAPESGSSGCRKIGLDLTQPLAGEASLRCIADSALPEAVRTLVSRRWKEYGLPPQPS